MATQGSRLLLWITALGLVIVAAVAVAVVLLLDAKPPGLSTEPQWLHAKVSGSLSDAPTSGSMLADPSDMPPLTTELTAAIRHAATDEAVEGLLLEVRPADVGWAQLQEIRSALQDFQDAGKPCMAWADAFSNKEYYLATACGEVHAPPTAITLVNGLSVTRSYYAEAFERYGVSANFEHVGDLIACQAREVLQLDDPCLAFVHRCEALEGLVEGDHIDIRLTSDDELFLQR